MGARIRVNYMLTRIFANVRVCARQRVHSDIAYFGRLAMRERAIENRFRNEVQKRGGRALKFTSPGNRGVPDRIVVLPEGGVVVFVELKAPGKQLEPLQVKWASVLRGMGHKVYAIDSQAGVDQFIAEVFGHGI